MVTGDVILGAIKRMRMLRYFPCVAESEIMELLVKLCPHDDAVVWLTAAACQLSEWPGPGELRRIVASRYRPADGRENISPAAPGEIDWNCFPGHETEHLKPPPELRQIETGGRLMIESETAPPMPAGELEQFHARTLGALIAKSWPRVCRGGVDEGALAKAEEKLRAEMAVAPKLTEAQKVSRLAALESALGRQA